MAGINLKVQIEMNGQFIQAGHITGSSFRDAAFSYDESYITSPAAHAISLSLPLSKKAFDTDATKSFFDGLLPEGFTRQCVADSIHASSDSKVESSIKSAVEEGRRPLVFTLMSTSPGIFPLRPSSPSLIEGVVQPLKTAKSRL